MAEILQFPEGVYPRSNQFWIISNSRDFISPFNSSSQTVSFPGARWGCSMEFANLTTYQARQLEILIAQMKAGAKWVRLRDFAVYPRPALGAPNVKDAGQLGEFVTTRGWSPNRIVLRLGDYVTIGQELKRVCADVISTAAGEATLQIVPPLRTSPLPGDLVEVKAPYGVFKLPSDNVPKPRRQPGIFTDVTIDFEEVLC
ncbi:hypothetical protein CQK57_03310 [Salmonella enterica]|uniref:hypothetical protein n=1 Tax=Salmonella enterica TaxID=28901 RepID=UPI00112F3196|nr:hypothetical protein [Salmonella enterica]EBG8067284.1 hypothetical protein [Salmonella enterica subsp. enterica serovar Elisabethville]EED8011839.1 hypothetical protein [Salmonella enterica subsp. enterica]EBH6156911.1 hypothetical protein [Salmonella enterica]ECE2658120.1 hypothetical protein [Salmonella enterica]EEE6705841.1 hypothetical protein [Salmonella enterica subsp. enterica serovar Elisabethville]